jgi:hypothetical protein
MDSAYSAKYISIAGMLWDACEGNAASIPQNYADHLHHTYLDGTVSLAPLLNRFEYEEPLTAEEFEEAIEMLGRVNPEDWPDIEDIVSLSLTELLSYEEEEEFSFSEDNLGTAEKIEKCLAKVIESVLGEPVSHIRGKGGSFPSPDNNFLQETDGTFAGSFRHGDHTMLFEIAPTESGWLCTYRLDPETLDKLPKLANEDKDEEDPTKKDYSRTPRNRGWR